MGWGWEKPTRICRFIDIEFVADGRPFYFSSLVSHTNSSLSIWPRHSSNAVKDTDLTVCAARIPVDICHTRDTDFFPVPLLHPRRHWVFSYAADTHSRYISNEFCAYVEFIGMLKTRVGKKISHFIRISEEKMSHLIWNAQCGHVHLVAVAAAAAFVRRIWICRGNEHSSWGDRNNRSRVATNTGGTQMIDNPKHVYRTANRATARRTMPHYEYEIQPHLTASEQPQHICIIIMWVTLKRYSNFHAMHNFESAWKQKQ